MLGPCCTVGPGQCGQRQGVAGGGGEQRLDVRAGCALEPLRPQQTMQHAYSENAWVRPDSGIRLESQSATLQEM